MAPGWKAAGRIVPCGSAGNSNDNSKQSVHGFGFGSGLGGALLLLAFKALLLAYKVFKGRLRSCSGLRRWMCGGDAAAAPEQ